MNRKTPHSMLQVYQRNIHRLFHLHPILERSPGYCCKMHCLQIDATCVRHKLWELESLACLSARLSARLSACSSSRLSACLSVRLSARLLACSLACSFACSSVVEMAQEWAIASEMV